MTLSPALPGRWLAFRLGHLGDVVLATGVLRHWGETKDLRFAVLTRPEWAPVFAGHPFVDRVVTLEKSALAGSAMLAAFRRIAREYEGWGLLDLHGNLRSRLMETLWRGPVARYRKMGLRRRIFLATRGRAGGGPLRALSTTQRYALALEEVPPPQKDLLPCIFLTEEEHARAAARLAGIQASGVRGAERQQTAPGLAGSPPPPVALHPFATHPLKAWPRAHWIELARLLDGRGIPWLVLGKGKELFPGDPRDLTNATTLREICALLSRCRALVTGDSGPMHLAAAVQTPVAALFGPTTREWGFYPSGEKDIIFEVPLPCRPCSLHGGSPCPRGGECLASIFPKTVLKGLERFTPPEPKAERAAEIQRATF